MKADRNPVLENRDSSILHHELRENPTRTKKKPRKRDAAAEV